MEPPSWSNYKYPLKSVTVNYETFPGELDLQLTLKYITSAGSPPPGGQTPRLMIHGKHQGEELVNLDLQRFVEQTPSQTRRRLNTITVHPLEARLVIEMSNHPSKAPDHYELVLEAPDALDVLTKVFHGLNIPWTHNQPGPLPSTSPSLYFASHQFLPGSQRAMLVASPFSPAPTPVGRAQSATSQRAANNLQPSSGIAFFGSTIPRSASQMGYQEQPAIPRRPKSAHPKLEEGRRSIDNIRRTQKLKRQVQDMAQTAEESGTRTGRSGGRSLQVKRDDEHNKVNMESQGGRSNKVNMEVQGEMDRENESLRFENLFDVINRVSDGWDRSFEKCQVATAEAVSQGKDGDGLLALWTDRGMALATEVDVICSRLAKKARVTKRARVTKKMRDPR